MIRLAKILDHIRKSKNIQTKFLVKYLGIKEADYKGMVYGWYSLSPKRLQMICEFLGLQIKDYAPLIQRMEREKLFYSIKALRHFKDLDDAAIQAISDSIYFKLEGAQFNSIIYPLILDKIYAVPQEIRIAIEELRSNQNRRSEQRDSSS